MTDVQDLRKLDPKPAVDKDKRNFKEADALDALGNVDREG